MIEAKKTYHHGDLKRCLLDAATQLIRQQGVEALSMRKLADSVGVSRTAPYHHFADKNALLSEIAEEGFRSYGDHVAQVVADPQRPPAEKLEGFVRSYVQFAIANPETYDLMFGHSIWKSGQPSASLKSLAHETFRGYVGLVEAWQQAGVLPIADSLRFAQVTWSTLHGLCRLMIDGVYVDDEKLDEKLESICQTALALFRQSLPLGGRSRNA